MFHRGWRQQALAELDQPFDLVVIGGGITGSGIFFDAALRGLRVLLVEKGDLASGTSSRSSKMIHGGLRYLKNLQFGITRTSVRERDRQGRVYPHLVHSIPWVYPSYSDYKTPAWQVELGLWLYDRMANSGDRYHRITRSELARMVPGLEQAEIEKILVYNDSIVDDARLTWSVAASGFASGGWVLTRTTLEEPILGADGSSKGLVLRDLTSGRTHSVEASLVVNATGAWVDGIRHIFGLEGRSVRPSRGSHLVFSHQDLPVKAAVTVLSPDDDRPVFFVPHPEGVLVGTTDLFHDGDLDDPRPAQEEVDYMLRAVAKAFPERRLGRQHLRGAFAGVRPVIDSDVEKPSDASREERIWHERGLLSVAGGKLTTWRVTAEEVVDQALKLLPAERVAGLAPCRTRATPLVGQPVPHLAARLVAAFGCREDVAQAMARRLGALAWTACELAADDDLQPLNAAVDLSLAEVRGHLRFGGVVHLSDLLLRRARLGLWTPEVARELVSSLRSICCAELGWSSQRWQAEEERFAVDAVAWCPEGIAAP